MHEEVASAVVKVSGCMVELSSGHAVVTSQRPRLHFSSHGALGLRANSNLEICSSRAPHSTDKGPNTARRCRRTTDAIARGRGKLRSRRSIRGDERRGPGRRAIRNCPRSKSHTRGDSSRMSNGGHRRTGWHINDGPLKLKRRA